MPLTNSLKRSAAAAALALTLAAPLFAPRPASAQAGACNFPGFSEPTSHPVQRQLSFAPVVVVAGDFNHDGATDLATSNYSTNDVSVLLAAPGGGFGPAAHYPTGFSPADIAVGDFDGDARLDLVTANDESDNGNLTILFGDGAGGFEKTKPLFLTPEGQLASTSAVVVADFNVDGNADLAAVGSGIVHVLLGDGDGDFTPQTFEFVNAFGPSAAAGDFNRDGRPDLAVALEETDNVAVMLGNGAGGLGAPALFAAGDSPRSLVVADFNKDNRLDLATGNITANVSVLLGNGAGAFAAPRSVPTGGQVARAIGAADFDADGNTDIVAASGSLLLLAGDGAGNFSPSANRELPLAGPSSLVVANLDFDARPDVAVGDPALSRVLALHTTCSAQSSTTFRAGGFLSAREGTNATVRVIREGNVKAAGSVGFSLSGGTALAGTDFKPASGTLSFAPGETFKEFQFETIQDALVEGVETVNVHLSNPVGGTLGTPNPAVFALNDDEPRPTLTVAGVSVAEGDAGTRNATFTLTLDRATLATLTVAYATADGTATAGPDYVAASGTLVFSPGQTSKTVSVAVRGDTLPEINESFTLNLTNRSAGSVTVPARATAIILDDDLSCPAPAFGAAATFSVGQRPKGLAAADFNGDGRTDLAVTAQFGSTHEVVILRNDGAGAFSVTSRVAVGLGPNDIVAADFDGDGKVDLAVTLDNANAVALLRGSGTGTFAAPVNFAVGQFPIDLVAADFNGDGRADLATANVGSRDISVLLNNGAGGFRPRLTERISSTSSPVPTSLAAADFNGDGRADLAVGSGPAVNGDANSGVAVLLGNGSGDFAEHDFTRLAGFADVAAGDFNRDGKADVVVARTAFGIVSVLLGTGTGDFAAPADYAAPNGPQGPAVADFNGDFNPDIVVANRTATPGGVTVFYNNGAGVFSQGVRFQVGQTPWRAVPADFDGDGRPDIATPNFSPGTVSVLLNACTGAPASAVQFSAASYSAREGDRFVNVTVNRTGDASAAASVTIASADATASERNDYTTLIATLRFAPGETTKTVPVLLTQDARQEPTESLTLALTNLVGAVIGSRGAAAVSVQDDDTPPPPGNPIDNSTQFVRQHYHDFLNREPDAAGLAFWTAGIEACGASADCRLNKRVDTSAAFFLSIEFQNTGYQVIRIYKATFDGGGPGRPRGLPRYREFLRDTRELGEGVVVGVGNWEERLRQNTQEFARRWVASPEFVADFPATLTAGAFVDKLFANSQVTPTAAERSAAVAAFGAGGTDGRAAALLSVTGSASVYNRQYNPAFVLMQYIGYLRRSPDAAPDTNFDGFDFWLNKLNSFTRPGEDARNEGVALDRVRRAEMIRAFIESIEYRQRFGQ